MADEPPWEWVPGDPVRAGRYRWITAAGMGVWPAILALAFLRPSDLIGAPAPTSDIWYGLAFACLAFTFVELVYLPKWFPVLDRIGISPLGVRFGFGFLKHEHTYVWRDVREVGPSWIAVSSGNSLRQRYRLTANQAHRLHYLLGIRGQGPPAV